MTNKEEIDQLRAELDKLKREVAGTNVPSEKDVARHRDEMHQLAERRMAYAAHFSVEDLRAMEQACPTDTVRGIVADNRGGTTPRGVLPPSQPAVGNVRAPVGSNTGWREATPIGPPPGVAACDRLMDHQDAVDRHDLMMQEARRLAAQKAIEKS